MKPGEHILRGHLWHNRRRNTDSDAFWGGARPGGRLAFEGGAEHSTRGIKALAGPCVRVLRSEGVPRPRSIFADELLSALSTPWSHKLRTEKRSSFKIRHIDHFVFGSSTFYSYGTWFAQAVFCAIEYRWSNEMCTRISVRHPLYAGHGKVRGSSQNQGPIYAQALSTPPFELAKAGHRRYSA